MMYRGKNFYKDNNIQLLTEKNATAIDAAKKTVTLDDGTVVDYEKLMNATGSRPFTPPMGGLDTLPKYFTFLSLDSAKELEKALAKKTRVLIIGAGLIGMFWKQLPNMIILRSPALQVCVLIQNKNQFSVQNQK